MKKTKLICPIHNVEMIWKQDYGNYYDTGDWVCQKCIWEAIKNTTK